MDIKFPEKSERLIFFQVHVWNLLHNHRLEGKFLGTNLVEITSQKKKGNSAIFFFAEEPLTK